FPVIHIPDEHMDVFRNPFFGVCREDYGNAKRLVVLSLQVFEDDMFPYQPVVGHDEHKVWRKYHLAPVFVIVPFPEDLIKRTEQLVTGPFIMDETSGMHVRQPEMRKPLHQFNLVILTVIENIDKPVDMVTVEKGALANALRDFLPDDVFLPAQADNPF